MNITIEKLIVNMTQAAQEEARGVLLTAMHCSTALPPRIGQQWDEQDGIYAGVMRGIDGAPDYHLIVTEHEATFAWGAQGTEEPGAKSDHNGLANTRALVASQHVHPAAEWAAEQQGPDCYLPSRRELRLCWVNVPELFDAQAWYWASTQYSPFTAWGQTFDDGQHYTGKSFEGRVRAVRRLVIE